MDDVKPGRREMYAALTKTAVLDAATELFAADGFDATSVDDIARKAQASKGAVYHHFADKREIFAEVFRTAQTEVMQAVLESTNASAQPWQRLEAATRGFLQHYAADQNARSLLRQAMHVLGWDRVRAIDAQTAVPIIRLALDELIAAGDIAPIPTDVAAETICSLYCHAILSIVADDNAAAVRDVEIVILALLGGLRG